MPLNTFSKINQHQLADLIEFDYKIYSINLIKDKENKRYIIPLFYNKPGVWKESLFCIFISWDPSSREGWGEWEFSMDKYPLRMRSAYIEKLTLKEFFNMCIQVHENVLEKNQLRDINREMGVIKPGKLYRFRRKYWDANGNILPIYPSLPPLI